MIDQEDEIKQINIENKISMALNDLYELLQASDRIEAEELLGKIAEAKAEWEGDYASKDNG